MHVSPARSSSGSFYVKIGVFFSYDSFYLFFFTFPLFSYVSGILVRYAGILAMPLRVF